jgi:hypothetical protein
LSLRLDHLSLGLMLQIKIIGGYRWALGLLSNLVRAWVGLLWLSIRTVEGDGCGYQKLVIGRQSRSLFLLNTNLVWIRLLPWLGATLLLLKLRLSFIVIQRPLVLYILLGVAYPRNSYCGNLSRLELRPIVISTLTSSNSTLRLRLLLLRRTRGPLPLLGYLLLSLPGVG